jgi:hypothetical protein
VSLTPSLRIWRPQVNRFERLVDAIRREGADLPRGHVVNGVDVLGNLNSPVRQLFAKAYRSRAGSPRGPGQLSDPLAELLRGKDEWLPEALPVRGVERGEDLATTRVQNRQSFPVARLGQRPAEGVQGADADSGNPRACRQPSCGREADADADERARPAADREPSHRLPTAADLDRSLDLGQEGGRVTRAALRREPKQLLVQDLAGAQRADGRICGRRVEADDRLSLGVQLSQ